MTMRGRARERGRHREREREMNKSTTNLSEFNRSHLGLGHFLGLEILGDLMSSLRHVASPKSVLFSLELLLEALEA